MLAPLAASVIEIPCFAVSPKIPASLDGGMTAFAQPEPVTGHFHMSVKNGL